MSASVTLFGSEDGGNSDQDNNAAYEKALQQNSNPNVQQYYQLPDGQSSAPLSETSQGSYQLSAYPPEEMSIKVNNEEVMKEVKNKSKCCLIC